MKIYCTLKCGCFFFKTETENPITINFRINSWLRNGVFRASILQMFPGLQRSPDCPIFTPLLGRLLLLWKIDWKKSVNVRFHGWGRVTFSELWWAAFSLPLQITSPRPTLRGVWKWSRSQISFSPKRDLGTRSGWKSTGLFFTIGRFYTRDG